MTGWNYSGVGWVHVVGEVRDSALESSRSTTPENKSQASQASTVHNTHTHKGTGVLVSGKLLTSAKPSERLILFVAEIFFFPNLKDDCVVRCYSRRGAVVRSEVEQKDVCSVRD